MSSTSPTNPTPSQQRIAELGQTVEELQGRLDTIEGVFSDRLVNREQAHTRAKQRDVQDELSVGDKRTVVIEQTAEETDGDPLARINGIVVFIKQAVYLSTGETVEVTITEVKSTCATAIVAE
jgi:predicted RNA-binding protein with TRAM domain